MILFLVFICYDNYELCFVLRDKLNFVHGVNLSVVIQPNQNVNKKKNIEFYHHLRYC